MTSGTFRCGNVKLANGHHMGRWRVGRNWDTEYHESKAVFVGLIALKRNVLPMFSNTREGKEKLGEAICLELKV